MTLSENDFRYLDERYGSGSRGGRIFHAAMGAEAVRDIIGRMDLEELAAPSTSRFGPRPASAARRPSSGCA
jgi:hypothetical protein